MTESLYVHIPFCKKKCAYCDFFSVPCPVTENSPNSCNPGIDDEYIDALISEIYFYAKFFSVESWKTVYIGGGTPGLMSESQLNSLSEGIFSSAGEKKCTEFTLEINPENVTENFLKEAEKCGITRISMGIQSFDGKSLSAVGRGAGPCEIMNALEILDKTWHGEFSVDFIAGLPYQSFSLFEKQFEILEKYRINHVSLYTLTVEENTPLYKNIENGITEWDSSLADKMWIKGRNILEKKGFKQYEVSNFAVPGHESVHNQVYWNAESYIGAGAGAAGTVYGEKSSLLKKTLSGRSVWDVPSVNAPPENSAIRWTNTNSISSYKDFWLSKRFNEERIFEIPPAVRETEILDLKTQEFEFLMTGFRMNSGISSSKFKKRFGHSLEEKLSENGGRFFEWQKKGLSKIYEKNGEKMFALTRRGILFLNLFLESLL